MTWNVEDLSALSTSPQTSSHERPGPCAFERPGTRISEAADLIGRIDRLVSDIQALKVEQAAMRAARARFCVPYHAKRQGSPDEQAEAA